MLRTDMSALREAMEGSLRGLQTAEDCVEGWLSESSDGHDAVQVAIATLRQQVAEDPAAMTCMFSKEPRRRRRSAA